jgi:hypothetical protein
MVGGEGEDVSGEIRPDALGCRMQKRNAGFGRRGEI